MYSLINKNKTKTIPITANTVSTKQTETFTKGIIDFTTVIDNVPKTTEIVVENKMKLTYKNTLIRTNGIVEDVYADSQEYLYYFDHHTHKLRSFSKYSKPGGLKLKKDEIQNRAESFIKNYVNLSEYTQINITDFSQEGITSYNIKFIKTIQGYRTDDYADVWLNEDGSIFQYYAPSETFKNITVPHIDEKKLLNNLESYIKNKLNIQEKHDIKNKTLKIDKNKRIYLEFSCVIGDTPYFFDADILTGTIVKI